MVTRKSSKKKENDDIEAVVPLLSMKHVSNNETRAHYITFEVKVMAGSDTAGKYKKYVRPFGDKTPDRLIKICDELDEIYTQNKIIKPTDQHTLVESVLRGESKEAYLTFMEEVCGTDEEGNRNDITEDMLTESKENTGCETTHGLHFGHFKSGIKDQEISKFDWNMRKLPMKYGFCTNFVEQSNQCRIIEEGKCFYYTKNENYMFTKCRI